MHKASCFVDWQVFFTSALQVLCVLLFCRVVVDSVSDIVDYWITFNEPHVFCMLTYCAGAWPGGNPDMLEAATSALPTGVFNQTMHWMAIAHSKAYDYIHEKRFLFLVKAWDKKDPVENISCVDGNLQYWVIRRWSPTHRHIFFYSCVSYINHACLPIIHLKSTKLKVPLIPSNQGCSLNIFIIIFI